MPDEATCFFHDANQAAIACGRCGRFLCHLCDIEVEGQHQCPACFESALQQQTLASLRQEDTLFDSMAMAAGACSWVLTLFSWFIAVPAVAYWTIAKWNSPRRYLVPRRRWRYAVAWIALLWLPLLFLLPRMARR